MAILKEKDLNNARRLQVKNILKKQAGGATLSAREERILAEAANDVSPGGENFLHTYEQLATRLHISRRGLQKVCLRYPDEFPTPRADGRHDVTAWLNFFLSKNIKGAAEDAAGEDGTSVKDWRIEEIKLKCTRLEIENAKVAGELVDASEVESGVSVLVGAFRQALNNLAPRLAGKIVGVKDYHEAEELIITEIDVVLRTLQRCDFLKLLESGVPQLAVSLQEDQVPASVPVKGTPRTASKKAASSKVTRVPSGKTRCVKRPSSNQKRGASTKRK